MDIRKIGLLKDSTGKVYGNRTRVKVVKNKVAPPFTEAEFDIIYGHGVSWAGSVLDTALVHGLVDKRGSWLSFDGEQLGQGHDASRTNLEGDPELLEKMIGKIKAKLQGGEPEAAKPKAKPAAAKAKDEPAAADSKAAKA